jgi:hypothetical protein
MRISTTAVTLVHTAIPVALVTAGVLGTAGHTALWLRGLVELWLIISAVVIGCSWLLEAGCVRCGRRLQAHKPDSSKARGTEALESVRAAFIFSCFAAWPRYMLATGRRIAWVWTLAEAQPEAPTSVMLYLVKVFLVTVLGAARRLHCVSIRRGVELTRVCVCVCMCVCVCVCVCVCA